MRVTTDAEDDASIEDADGGQLWPKRVALELRVRALQSGRGWKSRHSDDGELGEKWVYLGSFGGRPLSTDVQLCIGPLELGVEVEPVAVVLVHGCGVRRGCEAHASVEHRVPLDNGEELVSLLETVECRAREVDAAALARCVVFGPCGGQRCGRD